MRFVFGFCFAGLYIVIESWLSELSTPVNRGRTLAVYMIVSMSGLGIGQYLIAVGRPEHVPVVRAVVGARLDGARPDHAGRHCREPRDPTARTGVGT